MREKNEKREERNVGREKVDQFEVKKKVLVVVSFVIKMNGCEKVEKKERERKTGERKKKRRKIGEEFC